MSYSPAKHIEDPANVPEELVSVTSTVPSTDVESHKQSSSQDSTTEVLDLSSSREPLQDASGEPHNDEHDREHDHGHDEHDEDQEGAEYILELQEAIDSMHIDDPTRPMQLFLLGCAIADHHVKAKVAGAGDLPKAITLVEEAITLTPDDQNAQRSYYNALQNICWTAYQNTRDSSHLDDSIKYGRLAVGPRFPSDIEDPYTLLSQRYALALARTLRERFEMAALDDQRIEDLEEAIRLLAPAIAGENSIDHDSRLSTLCSLEALRAEFTGQIIYLDKAIALRKGHSIDALRGGWSNLQGLIGLLGRRYEWTMEQADLDHLVAMSRLAFLPNVRLHPDYTVPLEYMAGISDSPYRREGKKLFDLDTAICLHTVALLHIKRDCGINLQRRRGLLYEVGSLLDDRWKLKREVRDGYGADEADMERAQIEAILPFLGDGTRPLHECGPIGCYASYTSRVTGRDRGISGFRMVFRRTLKEGEEREESDVWSSSVPEMSSQSDADSVHSGRVDETVDVHKDQDGLGGPGQEGPATIHNSGPNEAQINQ